MRKPTTSLLRFALSVGGAAAAVLPVGAPAHAAAPLPPGMTQFVPITASPGADPLPPVCLGSGTDGPRVALVYLYSNDLANRSAEFVPALRTAAEEADRLLLLTASATKAPSARRVRWQTEKVGTSCRVKVTTIAVSTAIANGKDTVGKMKALEAAGVWRSGKGASLHTVIVSDSTTWNRGYCGYTFMTNDESPTGKYSKPTWASVDINPRCVSAPVLLHELFHTIGAVQVGAPHSTGATHCNDGADLMCYDDNNTTRSAQRSVCVPATEYRASGLVDCGGDDYFNVAPPAGSYLATRWNTANSQLLTAVTTPKGSAPVVSKVTGPASTIPHVPTPFALTVTATGGVGYVASTQEFNTIDSPFAGTPCRFSVKPTKTTGTQIVKGSMTCGVDDAALPSSVPSILADRLGRDVGFSLPVKFAKPATPLAGASTVTRLPDGSGVKVKVIGKLPNGSTTPLWGVRVWVASPTSQIGRSWYTGVNGEVTIPGTITAGQVYSVNSAVSPGSWAITPGTLRT